MSSCCKDMLTANKLFLEDVCHPVAKENCHVVYKEECHPVQSEECKTKYEEECQTEVSQQLSFKIYQKNNIEPQYVVLKADEYSAVAALVSHSGHATKCYYFHCASFKDKTTIYGKQSPRQRLVD